MTLAPTELLIEVEAAVLGGPELACLATGGAVAPPSAAVAPGEAAVGRVVQAGDAARELLGARVLTGPVTACGECDLCRRGHLGGCPAARRYGVDRPGALAGRVVVPTRWVCALAGRLDGAVPGPAAALIGREAALAYTMYTRAGVAPGETTVWLGDGLARLGAALARELGAAVAAPGEAAPPCKVFEVSGTPAGRLHAFALARAGVTLVLLAPRAAGQPAGDDATPAIPLGAALDAGVQLVAVDAPHPDLVPELVATIMRAGLDLGAHARVFAAGDRAAASAAARAGELCVLAAPFDSTGGPHP